jgi:hypothetical protein
MQGAFMLAELRQGCSSLLHFSHHETQHHAVSQCCCTWLANSVQYSNVPQTLLAYTLLELHLHQLARGTCLSRLADGFIHPLNATRSMPTLLRGHPLLAETAAKPTNCHRPV